jgi:hypothetical protein
MSPILNLIVFLVLSYFIYYAYTTYYVEESAKIYDIQKKIGSFITKDDMMTGMGDFEKELNTKLDVKLSEYKSLNSKLESDLVEINLKIEAYKKSTNDLDNSILENMIKLKEEIMLDVFKNIDILKSNLMTIISQSISSSNNANNNVNSELINKIEIELKTEVDRISFMINNLSLDLKNNKELNVTVSNQLNSKLNEEVNKLVNVDNMLGSKLLDLNNSVTKLIDDVNKSNIVELKALTDLNVESIKKVNDDLIISNNIGSNSSGLKELKDSTIESIKKMNDILSISENDIRMNSNGLKELKDLTADSIKKINDNLTINGNNIELNSVGLNNISNDMKNIVKKYDEYLISNDSYVKGINDRLLLSESSVKGNIEELNNLKNTVVDNIDKINNRILLNENGISSNKEELNIISNDLKNVSKKYEDYVFSNNSYTQKLNDKVESYINQNYLAIKNINDSIDIIKYGMGDIRLLNGVDMTSTLLDIKKQLNVYDGDHIVLNKLKADFDNMEGNIGNIMDINSLKDGFYNHIKILNRLEDVENILKNAKIVIDNSNANYTKYKANKAAFKGLNNTKREQMFLINDTIESLEKYISSLTLSDNNKNIIRDLINISKNELYEINGKDTLVSYLNNIQLTTGQLWSDSNSKDVKINNIENSLNLMTGVVGEVSLLNKNSIVDSIQKIQLDVRKLNDIGIETSDNLNSFKNSVSTEVKKIGDVIKYNSIVDTLVGDVQVLMNRTGTGNIRYKDLATSAENLYNDLQTQTGILSSANKDISSIKSILGNYVVAEQGGDVAQILKDMNTNLKYLYSNLGSYRKDDFNQMTVETLLKDITNRINGVELFSLNNKNTSRDLADIISKVSDLKTFVGSGIGNTSLVDRINNIELKLVDLVNITNSSNDQQTNMKKSIDYLNKNSDEIRPLIANFSVYLESIENIKPVGPNISQSIINLFNSTTSNIDSIGKVSNLVDTLSKDVNKTISDQIQSSTKLNELYSSLDKVNTNIISINDKLFSQKISLDDVKSKIDLISQVSFLPKLIKPLSDISKSYPLLKIEIDALVPSAGETVRQINLFLDKYKSDIMLVEWQANYEFYSYISKIQKGLTEMYAAMESKIKFGATVDSFNQTDMNKLVPMYMYNYFNEPFLQYLKVMSEWVENTPIWYQLGKNTDDVDNINKSITTFNNDILFLKTYKGNMETQVNGIVTKLNNIGNWNPITMNSTLSDSLINLISKNISMESTLNNIQTITGSLKDINYPNISSAVVDLLSKAKSIEDKQIINSKDIESIKDSSSKLLSGIGQYNGNLLTDITSIKQNLTDVESEIDTNFNGISSRLDKVESDLKYSTIATLINNIQILARFDPRAIIYDTITEYHKTQVSSIPQLAKDININTLTTWKPLFLNIDTVVKLRNLLNGLALDKLPMISMLEYQKVNNFIYLTTVNTKSAIESLIGVESEKNIQTHVVEILDNYKLLSDKVSSIQTSSGVTGDQVASNIMNLKLIIIDIMKYKQRLVQTNQVIAIVNNLNLLSIEIDKYKTGFVNDSFFDLLKDTITKMNNNSVFNGNYTGADESSILMSRLSKPFLTFSNEIFNNTNQTIPERLRQLWSKAGTYTGVSIQEDINDLNTKLTSLTNSFNTFNINTSDTLISLDNRIKSLESDIINIKTATASTGGSTNLSIPETILPSISVTNGTYYALCTIQNGNIVSESYPSTYTGTKLSINMSIANMEQCILNNPTNTSISYVAFYIQKYRTPTKFTLGSSEGIIQKYLLSSSLNSQPDTISFNGGSDTSAGNENNLSEVQVSFGTPHNPLVALNLINSAKYITLKARDNSKITFRFTVVIKSTISIPEHKVNSIDKMFTINNALSRSYKVPVADSNSVINFTKGFVLDKKYANEQPTSCSNSGGVYTCNCPNNSYVCGINYNVPMSSITSLNPQCCSFNF